MGIPAKPLGLDLAANPSHARPMFYMAGGPAKTKTQGSGVGRVVQLSRRIGQLSSLVSWGGTGNPKNSTPTLPLDPACRSGRGAGVYLRTHTAARVAEAGEGLARKNSRS